MKRYLVTGSSGFLGSHVVDYLIKEKNKVTCIDIVKTKFQNPKAKYIFDDLNKLEILNKYLKNIDIVVHLAAMSDINKTKKNRIDAINQNIVVTAKILESMKKNNVKKIIFSSSIYAYSRTGSIYKITKQTTTETIASPPGNVTVSNSFTFSLKNNASSAETGGGFFAFGGPVNMRP